MKKEQEIAQWFNDILFKLKLIEAQLNVIEPSDITEYAITELKEMNTFFVEICDIVQNFKQEISNKKRQESCNVGNNNA